MNRRVVITGLGVVSPLGNSHQALWDALSAGRSGVAPLVNLPVLEGRVAFAGECRDFTGEIENFGELEKDLKKSIRKALKMMCRESMMAVAAAQQAIVDGGFGATPMDPDTSGVVFGSDYMLSPPDDFQTAMATCGTTAGKFEYDKWGGDGLKGMNPLWMLNYLPNMPGSHIAIFNNLCGPNNSLTMREASGLLSIREATQTIARGHAERMIAGATGTRIHSFKTVHALQQEQLANAELPPAEASRPFDADRTGMVIGEGAGAILLEEYDAAKARGAKIYGEVVGTSSTTVFRVHGASVKQANAASGEQALESAARHALSDAKMKPSELGHVNAHALGTPAGDAEEARALAKALGDAASKIPVVAAKSYFGNLGAGSGVVETIASVLALHHGELFATLNFETGDAGFDLNVASRAKPAAAADLRQAAGESFLKLSATPQGQATGIVVRRVP